MSEKKIEDVVYEDGINLAFIADQLAGVDSMLTFVIDCARIAENFKHFQEKLTNGLTAVSITKAINVDEYINSHTTGYVVKAKQAKGYGDGSSNVVDYYRDDEGLPVIFNTREEIRNSINKSLEIIRVIDLAEEAARRAE